MMHVTIDDDGRATVALDVAFTTPDSDAANMILRKIREVIADNATPAPGSFITRVTMPDPTEGSA